MIHDEENRNGKGIELSDFISIVEDLVYGKIRQILVSPDQFAMEEIETLTSSIRLVIIDLELLLHSPSSTTFTDSSISDLCRISLSIITCILPNDRLFTASYGTYSNSAALKQNGRLLPLTNQRTLQRTETRLNHSAHTTAQPRQKCSGYNP